MVHQLDYSTTAVSTLLSQHEQVSDSALIAHLILASAGHFFHGLSDADVRQLTHYLLSLRAPRDAVIIREGDVDDYMIFVLQGEVQVLKRDKLGNSHWMSTISAGMSLGEMSMIDGEPRFATCITQQASVLAVLTRDALVRMLVEHPHLGSKLLIKLISLLTKRLRQTSASLLHYMEG